MNKVKKSNQKENEKFYPSKDEIRHDQLMYDWYAELNSQELLTKLKGDQK